MSGNAAPFKTEDLELEIQKVYAYHDVPRLFSARSLEGELWLVHWVDEHEHDAGGQDDWLCVRITEERLAKVERGEIDLHDALRRAEGGQGLLVEASWPNGLDVARVVALADLDPGLFCEPGVKLRD